MALSSRSLITKTGINTTQVFDMGGINISSGDFNLGSNIKLGNASGIITASSFVGAVTGTASNASGATGDFSIADKIVHTGDTNTAIRFPSADTIQFETGGSNKLSIGSSITSTTAITIHNADPELTFRDSNHSPFYYHFKAVGGSFNLSDSVNGNRIVFSANGSASVVAPTFVMTGGAQVSSNLGVTGNIIISDQIIHDGDTDTKIRFPAADTFSVETAGSERLRVGSSGQLGIAGANYGSSGQVLTSGGSGSAVSWSTISGTTINNNANDRIITGSGTANTLEGEANLTFNGTNLLTVHVPSATGEPAINFTNSDTGTGTGNGFGLGINSSESPYIWNRENTALRIATNNTERFRIHADGKVTIAGGTTAQETSTGLLLLDKDLTAESDVSDKNNYHLVIRSQSNSNTSKLGIAFANTSDDTHVGAAILHHRTSTDSIGDLAFYTSPSSGTTTERFRIDKDGKFYKAGNQFYPLVNYVEVGSFSGVNVSASSYTDLRTIYSSYSPKKANNRIVIHHQSQMWNGTNATGNGDVFWRILKDEGGGYSAIITNERILGNHDGRNYTGGSGLARHHRTVHLMGSFICNGNNFNLKTQGRSNGSVGWDWYHDANNILQIWEYET